MKINQTLKKYLKNGLRRFGKLGFVNYLGQLEIRSIRNYKRAVALALTFTMILTIVIISPWNKSTPVAHAAWYNSGGTYWNYRSTITIDHTKVGAGGVTNFPVLVTEANMPAGLWTHAKSDGSDLRMTAQDGTTEINFEKVSFAPATPKMELWFLASSLSSSVDTTFYLYWGNSAASAKAASWGQGVWVNYAGVYHLPNGSALTANDSTVNGKNGVITGTIAGTGKIDGAASFAGVANDYIKPPDSVIPATNYTVDLWANRSGWDSRSNYNVLFGWGGSLQPKFAPVYKNDVGKFYFGGWGTDYTTNISFPTGTWFNVVVVVTNNIARMYINNVDSGMSVNVSGVSATNFYFGRHVEQSTASASFNGLIDEVRVSTVTRTAADLLTSYNNQLTPSTFYSMDAEAAGDIIAPTNPTVIDGYSTSGKTTPITSGNFYNYPTPYFEWPAAEAVGGAHDTGNTFVSGVAGYYSYFGTSCGVGGADPALTRGVLADTGGGLHYSATTNITMPDLTTNNGTYCLRMKTKDVAGNVSAAYEAFAAYKYDATPPNTPSYIAANPAGYTVTNSFSFSWPVATDSGGSGIAGYQYERGGSSGDSWSATQAGTSVSAITAYQDGGNIFLVRSIDNAGNYSSTVQTTYYYSANPPTKPTGVTATPTVSDINSFSFSWTAPVHPQAIVDYGYSVNAYPTNLNLTWTGSDATSVGPDAFATIQGENTFYIVAKDEGGNYSVDAASVGSVVFNCQTVAPPIPASVIITDSSNQAISLWALTLTWSAGAGQDPSTFNHYSIERSTNGVDFTELATSTSTAYIDATGLDNITTYYYQIRAVDNAGAVSAASGIVSKIPTGKYDTPPPTISGPDVAIHATTATISWVASRISTSSVRFDTDAGDLSRSQIDPVAKTDHSISISGLTPGTKYYYQTQSLDEYRSYSSESAYSITYSFTTLVAPSIANVVVSNITLTTADVSFETNAPANFVLDYGTSIAYGKGAAEASGSYTTNHSINLNNLTHTTKYHFKLTGTDIDGNPLTSDDYVFETQPMPTISSIQFQPNFSGVTLSVVITWITNVPTSSSVKYAPTNTSDVVAFEENQSALMTEHTVTISGLKDDTQYGFVISGVDQYGNEVKSDVNTFTTPIDITPPVISDLTIETSNVGLGKEDKAQIVVSWTTNKSASSMVEYGEGVSGDQYTSKTTEDKGLVTEHLVIISDLTPKTPYHLHAVSSDKNGNIGKSDDTTTMPGEVQKSILQIILQTLQNVFGWLGKL